MKLRNEKEIERLSVAHANMVSDASFPEWHGREASFRRGYTQAQQDLLSQAVEGFNENWFSRELNVICNDYEMDEHKETWQAAKLSQAKELEDRREEMIRLNTLLGKTANAHLIEAHKVEKLQKENEELRKDFTHFLEKVQYVMPQNIEPEGCCNGRDCGCLGKPTNPEYYVNQLRDEYLSKWLKGEANE